MAEEERDLEEDSDHVPEAPQKVVDLMAALEASLARAKAAQKARKP